MEQLFVFEYDGKLQQITFIETLDVTKGVTCDVYTFDGDDSKDLGIIKINSDSNTPLQKVLKGEKTIEGHLSGQGKLVITQTDGKRHEYPVGESTEKRFEVIVGIGETMQWQADPESKLVAYEICFPPYEDGRYENLSK